MIRFTYKWNRIAVRAAILSFVLGTLFMLMALMAENDLVITFGIAFLALYLPSTLLTLFILFVNTMVNFKDIYEHSITLIIVLTNIPIALLYIHFLI